MLRRFLVYLFGFPERHYDRRREADRLERLRAASLATATGVHPLGRMLGENFSDDHARPMSFQSSGGTGKGELDANYVPDWAMPETGEK
jgi:hypothetical protein